jgi:5S rRNA maturation endonuclease (ribonuclease M5)
MDQQRKLKHVLSELDRYTGEMRRGASSSLILCPFHSERTPSGRISHGSDTKSPGYFKCYGCGKTAKWDELAPVIGLKPIRWTKPEEQHALRIVRKDRDEKEEKRRIDLTDLPRGKRWREIPTDLLIDIGCRKGRFYYPEDDVHGRPWVFMPVLVHGEQAGYIRGALKKEADRPSYINSPGGWTKDYGLFPYDYTAVLARRLRYVVLVEGQRDALRLLKMGIPALAILGTQSWSARKSRLIEMLGIDFVVLMMDGDCAGIAAVELIRPELVKLVNTVEFDLAGPDSPYWPFRNKREPSKVAKARGVELWDPQNLPVRKLKQLRASIRAWSTEYGSSPE